MHKSLKKSLLIITGILVLAIVATKLIVMHCQSMRTELAVCDSVFDSIDTTGFCIRHETEITNNSKGIYNFVLNDGEKVKKGGLIAEIYEDEQSALAQKKLTNLSTNLNLLENFLNISKTISTNPNYLEKQMHQSLKELLSNINTSGYDKLSKNKEQLLYSLNERQIVKGNGVDFSQKVQQLKDQISDLQKVCGKKVGSIISSESGYFVGTVDGYENAVDYKKAKSLSFEQVKSLLNMEPVKSNAASKIVNNSKWYIVCCVGKDDAFKVKQGAFVDVTMPFTRLGKIPAQIVAVNQEGISSDSSVILSCNYINKDLLALRKEDIRINLSNYSGIRIDKKAIHEKAMTKTVLDENQNETTIQKNVQGVYVLSGKQLVFKEIQINYIGTNYAICAKDPEKESLFSGNCLHVYDEVVVRGSDLYDGKTVK